ncbi:MAG: hypothetical protein HPPSJP_0180 [Candidatus Hepatoplasma scabrum]|nr:MAG: hypothetical protein HPPSJP_0180 [Candidatus Hepatoplasma sp.]
MKYEILIMLFPNLTETKQQDLILKIEKILNAKIIKKEDWGLKKLAYKIKHQEQAHYLLYYLETEIDNLNKFKKMISINKDVMRIFVLKHEKKWPFEMKTSKDLKFPERKQIRRDGKNMQTNLEKRPVKESYK